MSYGIMQVKWWTVVLKYRAVSGKCCKRVLKCIGPYIDSHSLYVFILLCAYASRAKMNDSQWLPYDKNN